MMIADSAKFDVRTEDDRRSLSLGADVGIYFDLPFRDLSDNILYVYQRFLERCQKDLLRWYMTGAMNKHHRVNSRTFNILHTWLKARTRLRETIFFEIRDGDDYVDTPNYRFTIFANSQESFSFEDRSNYVQILMPASVLSDDPGGFVAFVTDICHNFPLSSGHAGYVLERSPYAPNKAYDLAYPLAMRHPGADISDMFEASYAVKEDGIKGVNWLTMLGPHFVEQLGGTQKIRSQPKPENQIIETRNGVILKAGERPEIGDVNRQVELSAYRAAFKTIKPILVEWYPSFNLQRDDEEDLTMRWVHRFDEDA
ncbi:MAG: DUF3396 domain-containing protein [Mesorhizobium sp.]|uniref:type VI immunity family protein n=1 Tax=Mesorhizobium sp. TaxID=1871066 RepID=UPI0012186CB5|nr:type VI immunity family protein [Mesorhizobium sp.]TIM45814.1 MAG: DUF3396 domain-containing protein [Mesorhizobium sp.]